MEIKLTLALPRDELSVPVARRVLSQALEVLGVEPDDVSDIGVALTEACTNVLDHAADTDEYEVSSGIDGSVCVIEVVDRGGGDFDGTDLGLDDAHEGAEGGRGIQLMRALVDTVRFESRPQVGTVVHLQKQLRFQDSSVIQALSEGPATRHGPWSTDETMDDAPEPV